MQTRAAMLIFYAFSMLILSLAVYANSSSSHHNSGYELNNNIVTGPRYTRVPGARLPPVPAPRYSRVPAPKYERVPGRGQGQSMVPGATLPAFPGR